MEFFKKLVPYVLTIARVFAKGNPVSLIVLSVLDSVVNEVNKNEGVSDESAKDIIIKIAKSKRNNIDQDKIVKALKVLGLDKISAEDLEEIQEAPKRVIKKATRVTTRVKKTEIK